MLLSKVLHLHQAIIKWGAVGLGAITWCYHSRQHYPLVTATRPTVLAHTHTKTSNAYGNWLRAFSYAWRLALGHKSRRHEADEEVRGGATDSYLALNCTNRKSLKRYWSSSESKLWWLLNWKVNDPWVMGLNVAPALCRLHPGMRTRR